VPTVIVPAGDLHPLVQRNVSSLGRQRFTSIFGGDEFFLRDHVVNGEKVLSGVCYLEMARAALTQSIEADAAVLGIGPIRIAPLADRISASVLPCDLAQFDPENSGICLDGLRQRSTSHFQVAHAGQYLLAVHSIAVEKTRPRKYGCKTLPAQT